MTATDESGVLYREGSLRVVGAIQEGARYVHSAVWMGVTGLSASRDVSAVMDALEEVCRDG